MSLPKTCVLWLAVCCLGGCMYTMHPVATEDVTVDEPDLSGRWQKVGPEQGIDVQAVVLTKAGNQTPGSYSMELVHEKDKRSAGWRAQLLKLDEALYLEISLADSSLDKVQAAFTVRLHKLFRVTVVDDELRVEFCNESELHKAAQKEGLAVSRAGGERLVIMASSQKLQKLYREHAGDLFNEKRAVRFRKEH